LGDALISTVVLAGAAFLVVKTGGAAAPVLRGIPKQK